MSQEDAWQALRAVLEKTSVKPALRLPPPIKLPSHWAIEAAVKRILFARYLRGARRLALVDCYSRENAQAWQLAGCEPRELCLYGTPVSADDERLEVSAFNLGDAPLEEPERCDAVLAIYTLQNFFDSEVRASRFFANVASLLKRGGAFVCFFHNARALSELVQGRLSYVGEAFHVEADSGDAPFGARYLLIERLCDGAERRTEGALVYRSVLVALAAKHGLWPHKQLPGEVGGLLESTTAGCFNYAPSYTGAEDLTRLERLKSVIVFFKA